MYNFTFHRPTGLRQASNMLGKLEEPKILAGGIRGRTVVDVAT